MCYNKTKQSISSQKLGSWTFGELPVVFSRKLNLLYFLYSAIQKCFPVHLIKQNYLIKTLLRTLILMTGIFLTAFPSRTNLKLHNISVIPKVVKKVVTNLDSSRVSGLDCMPVLALKNEEAELSYILAEPFNKCLKESCFSDC